MSVRVYVTVRMTGRPWAALVREAKSTVATLKRYGIEPISPVLREIETLGYVPDGICGSRPTPVPLSVHWTRDKADVRRSHVLLDTTNGVHSEGASYERGYARFFLWIPVVRILPRRMQNGIAVLEDDVVVTSLPDAVMVIKRRWGTRGQRLRWRAGMYARSWPKAMWRKLGAWG